MTDRGKIITIYTVVGILSVGVLATSFWIRGSRKSRFVSPIADKIGGDVVEDFGSLENDLTFTNQDGQVVKLVVGKSIGHPLSVGLGLDGLSKRGVAKNTFVL